MTTYLSEATAGRPLENLGISTSEERVYRWLLEHPAASAAEAAQGLLFAPDEAQTLLDVLESKGLATHTPEHPSRYVPSAPDVALRAMFLQRQEALLGVQRTIQELQERASAVRSRRGDQGQMVELISSREAERQILEQMERAVEKEFISLMRPPMRVSQLSVPAEEEHPFQKQAQSRGVHYRSVVDAELMELPGFVDGMRSDLEAGEQIRVLPYLPLKLVMADHRLAIIPLNLNELDSPALLVRSSALLDALHELFEVFWERAAPVSFPQANDLRLGEPELQMSAEIKDLITLLATGLNDKTIASDLSVSKRTFERRISELMQTLSARTRFQAGWIAALRLSGRAPGVPPENTGDSGSIR